ncbi:MAG: cyclic pyranopterin monophosphate synthase MoaC [Bacillota bacterium]|nr:cyclic pyranopterin monophosphate synthase MoaC [Bacillota bacterium]
MGEEGARLSHLDEAGRVHMVDVSGKEASVRVAVARGRVTMSRRTLDLVRQAALPKGDVLAVARVAGIMAAKEASRLIPLCHPLPLDHIHIDLRLRDGGGAQGAAEGRPEGRGQGAAEGDAEGRLKGRAEGSSEGWAEVLIQATVRARAPTGAEMEALTAVMGAALAVYDMCKGADKGMVIGEVRLVRKEGGRSGRWEREGEELWPCSDE